MGQSTSGFQDGQAKLSSRGAAVERLKLERELTWIASKAAIMCAFECRMRPTYRSNSFFRTTYIQLVFRIFTYRLTRLSELLGIF